MVTVFTDGAYSSTRQQGGVGIVFVIDGKKVCEFSKGYKDTTNNRCEILAVLHALNAVNSDEITIYTDSQYVIGCATKLWERKKNQDLWRKYDSLAKDKKIEFHWVKGHTNCDDFEHKMNNIADKLAQEASNEYI
jgi:ribonuclease HI